MDRRRRLLWMQGILEHLSQCCDEWQQADASTVPYLTDVMTRELDELRRLLGMPEPVAGP